MAEPPIDAKKDNRVLHFKQRLGMVLCLLYALVYAGFVAISVFDVTLMDTLMPFGLNLAVFYGLGLILLALILAMIYSMACAASERKATLNSRQNPASPSAKGGADG